MSAPALASCVNHPQREALGVCVKCRTRVCSECSTKVEGINYCVSCLAGLATDAGGASPVAPGAGSRAFGWLSAAGYLVTLSALLWLLLEATLPGNG